MVGDGLSKPFWDALGGALGSSSSIKTPLERRGVAGAAPTAQPEEAGPGRELAQGKGSGEGAQVSGRGGGACFLPGSPPRKHFRLGGRGGFTGGRDGWQEKGWWAPHPRGVRGALRGTRLHSANRQGLL